MPTIRERNGRFQAIVRVKRAGVLVHAESKTFERRAAAAAWAERVERDIERNGVPARRTSMSKFGDLIDKYRQARNEVKPLGRAFLGDLDMLERSLGHVRLDDLSPEVFCTFARTRREAAGPATVLHNLSVAKTVLEAARPMFGLDVSGEPVRQAIGTLHYTGHVARSERRERRASDAELDALVREFQRLQGHPATVIPMHQIVPLAVHLPRRLGELCDMRWEDYTDGVVLLRDTKHPRRTRNERVPVPPLARAILDVLPKIDARILPYKAESVSASFQRAVARLGIRDLRFHDLRHEGICRLFETGLSIPEVSLVSGHLSWSTLRRYTHLTPENVLEKMNARQQEAP